MNRAPLPAFYPGTTCPVLAHQACTQSMAELLQRARNARQAAIACRAGVASQRSAAQDFSLQARHYVRAARVARDSTP